MRKENLFRRFWIMVLVISTLLGIVPVATLADGAAVPAEASSLFCIDKTADGLDKNDQTNVTLTVPGDAEGYIDVIFILGGGMNANRKTVESAINVFASSMESGKATIRLGIISLEKGQEIILDLNSDEALLKPDTYAQLIEEKFAYMKTLPIGSTNLHSQLCEAQKMLEKETLAKPENKYVFVLATGRTYFFDDANGNQATIVNKLKSNNKDNFYYADYLWRSQRGGHTSLYMLPDRYNDSYEAFFADVEKWVEDDGDKYVYTLPIDKNDHYAFSEWYGKNNKDLRALGIAGSRYGLGIVDPAPEAKDFITGVADGASSGSNPYDVLGYERAQYECVKVYKELVAAGYKCYSICSETAYYQNNSEYITDGQGYKGTSRAQLGHSFMNYLATLGGQTEAPAVWDFRRDENGTLISTEEVLQENFFDSIRDDIVHYCSVGSVVVDYIGKNENGNFEFIEDADHIKLNVGGDDYTCVSADTAKYTDENGEAAKSSYAFIAPGATEPSFWLDYFYGDGKTTERIVWTFGENVSLVRKAALTYKLQLTEKQAETGEYIVPTNNSAVLYPVDSDGVDGEPQVFPVPEVKYTVSKISISVNKIWDDEDDQDGIRPESINVNLLANGTVIETKEITEADGWMWTFAGLDKYEAGEEIVYTITELAVEGYETVIDGFTVTNVHEPESVIEDPDVPLGVPDIPQASAPETSDSSMFWLIAAAVSGILLIFCIKPRKRSDGRR